MNTYDRDETLASVVDHGGAMVVELQPGDVVTLLTPKGLCSSTFITSTTHPIWPHLRLVVWRTDPRLMLPGNWSHDALDPRQVVGTVKPATHVERLERLRDALLGGSR